MFEMRIWLLLPFFLIELTNGSAAVDLGETRMSNRIVLETRMDKSELLSLSSSYQFKYIDTFESKNRSYFILESIDSNKIRVSLFFYSEVERVSGEVFEKTQSLYRWDLWGSVWINKDQYISIRVNRGVNKSVKRFFNVMYS